MVGRSKWIDNVLTILGWTLIIGSVLLTSVVPVGYIILAVCNSLG